MKPRSSLKNKENPADDNYFARIVSVTRLGLQPGFTWEGEDIEPEYKIEITYELVTTQMADGRPFHVSEEVNDKDSPKGNLYQRIIAANADLNDITSLINRPVMVTTKQNAKGYAKIKNVAGIPSGIPIPELRNPTSAFDIYSEEPDVDAFNAMSEFKRNKITQALDFKTTPLFRAIASQSDDIPF